LLKKYETKITCCGLKYLDKLVTVKEKEKKKHKEKTRQEAQLLVSISEVSAPADTPQVYPSVDLFSPFDNPDFIASFANYNPLDPFWSDQGIGFGTPQTS
jgi:hypothetical protein